MGRIIYQDVVKELTTAAGTATVNSDRMQGEILLIWVKAATATTVFDFQIIDPAPTSRILRPYTSEKGFIRDSVILPVNGVHALKVINSTANELFKILLRVREIT